MTSADGFDLPRSSESDARGDRVARQHLALLEASVARLNDIVLITEADPCDEPGPRIVFVNDAFERITGYRREEVLGRSPRFLQGPLTDRRELDRIRAAIAKHEPVHSELINYTKAGTPVWLELDIVPVADAGGRTTHFVAVQRDITERKRVIQALHASEERFKSVARVTSDTIWDWDLATDRLWWSEGLQGTFGHAPADLPPDSRGWTEQLHPDDRERVLQNVRHAIDGGGESWASEYRFRRKDGRYAYVLDRGSVIRDETGRAIRMVGGMTDLTSRNEAELELARLNRALRVRSACDEAVVHATDEQALLNDICRIAVNVGGYRMAWVGYVQDDDAQSVRPVAHAGRGAGEYLEGIQLSRLPATPAGRGPVGRALRSHEVIVIEDLEREPGFEPWLDAALRQGYRSLVTLPLHDAERTYGVFALFAPDVSHISPDEVRLLQELTDDLAYAIATLRARLEQDRIQAAVLKIAAGVSVASGSAFFEELVGRMTEALGADAGFIARIQPGEPPSARTEVAYVEGRLIPNFEYPLAGTPCAHLAESRSYVIPAQAGERFPCTAGLCTRGAQAYVGHRLDNSAGEPIGQLFVLFSHPLRDTAFITSTLQIFATRVASELERQTTDARLRQQASLLDKAQDAIMVRDLDHVVRYWNKGAERLYGWTHDEVLGRSTEALLYSDPAAFRENTVKVLEHGEWSGEITQHRKDGSTLIVEAHWTLLRDDQQRPEAILAINTDITERKAAEREIQYLAFYDHLTGLPNRQLLRDRLQHALAVEARSQQVGALLFIDVDNFKTLNDTLGHAIGDLFLQQLAGRLQACLRKGDTLARLGGDEFVIVLENLAAAPRDAATLATAVGEKILAGFATPFQLADYVHHCTASIGITLFNDQPATQDELLQRADLAMYQAKAQGRNTLRFFDPAMQAVVAARAELEAELRGALARHAFELHYQAQVDSLGRLCGAEALLRWHHPERGWIPPISFIPLAEETGLILPIGLGVLESACMQLVAWATLPHMAGLSVAVNVSARQFRQADFVDQVLQVIDRTGANPHRLKLELTESLLVDNMEETIVKMRALKARGIGFSLDDFGTGYSSLAYLKQLPLDEIKIDQSFVRDVLTDPNDASIAHSILALGQGLNLAVVAEGVETAEQHAFLAKHGCDAYQGYLFNKPQPASIFEAWARSHQGCAAAARHPASIAPPAATRSVSP
ncbi:bifunctional diguanylate cyclase/phosphodiesterase [Thiobacillus sedimenti]|uniref:EAL domain-containing protein n=1 Tax=Thiobacillus sedimenti TaxID=3110231 RepID=A0ABZ1CG61_9PROT|nr:EAL domain-containing protein [Thiobacillus sp. SCUT-2]WRS37975.1 EAL domain-containing protein [Thiobacillus sp. SCUT-2]